MVVISFFCGTNVPKSQESSSSKITIILNKTPAKHNDFAIIYGKQNYLSGTWERWKGVFSTFPF